MNAYVCVCVCVCVCSWSMTSVTEPSLCHYRPDGIGTVSVDEKERFENIKDRLRVLLENQITHFR